ncbi:AraC family transcriptional regulator [Rhodonellum sp.]|uniref:helix-turn-helix domain-containing protein n=1 Tax=Rhodonellum sp. TaxID=2231180 RepID=UPI002727FDFF|nr:helix-turn-helix domain-containing protein [Rhodonellum sp.]MDO9554507.1 helix-turn-helix domain-containing protein [Rhodonellum sp.]
MIQRFQHPAIASTFILADQEDISSAILFADRHLKFIWNQDEKELSLTVDGLSLTLLQNQILCCTYNQDIQIPNGDNALVVLFFNKEFYCIHTFDQEVSCNGLLFFGSDFTPVIQLDDEETQSLGFLVEVLKKEFKTVDNNQEEMLRILLKRFIILVTRLARKQLLKVSTNPREIDVLRQFNSLVEEHFKTKKNVGEYADLMNRSPKTIANIFTKLSKKSPLQVIHDRVSMEAKRLLLYTDVPIKSIGYELGYEDYAQFSKFFKKNTGTNPQEFRIKNPGLAKTL